MKSQEFSKMSGYDKMSSFNMTQGQFGNLNSTDLDFFNLKREMREIKRQKPSRITINQSTLSTN